MVDEDLSKLKIDRSVKSFRPAKRRRWVYVFMIVFLLFVAGFLYRNGLISPAIPVEVATVSLVYPSQTLSQLNASGYVVAQRKAAVASKITGRLVALMVEEGDRVKEGQVVARLENADAVAARDQAEANLKLSRAHLEEAKAQLEEATKTFTRYKHLIEGGYIARSEYDGAEARFLSARAAVTAAEAAINANGAALEAANVTVEYALIKAPFDAVVLTKNADVGDIVTPLGAAANAKAAVVTIADMNSLLVEADVSETNLALVKVGQPCEIQLDAIPDKRFRGIVHAIVPTVDRSKATIMVKVSFVEKNPQILPEMRAKVTFLSRAIKEEEQKPRTALDPDALLTRDGRNFVFVLQGNIAVETPVTLGSKLGEFIEVVEGVKAGDRVILRPPKRLKNRSRIKILEK
jgi:RND family efflux transporter MFP subunit